MDNPKCVFSLYNFTNPRWERIVIWPINVCSVKMSHYVLNIHGWSKGQHYSHWQVNVLMCPCKQTKFQVPLWVPAMCPWCIDDGLQQQRCDRSIFVAMQDRCPLWSASYSVLIKTLISSAIWWFCTQSVGVLPPSASHLKVSSNLSSNTTTTGSVFLAPIFLSATFSMKALISPHYSS